jgi:hypothetical protein
VLLAAALPASPAGAQDAAFQQKVAAAKQTAARNQQALRSYSWIEETQLSYKGELKNTKVESCQYGPDGRVVKTALSDPPPQEQKRGLRGRIVEKKKGEMKEEMESATALVKSYIPPTPDKIQAAIAASTVSLSPAGPGAVAITFKDYNKPGDSMMLTFESELKALRKISVASYLEDPSKPVTLEVEFQSLPDGTNYPALEALSIPGSHIDVRIKNSNYNKLAP